MAFFGITIEKLASVVNHPNADRLEIATCENLGFQMIVPKGKFKPGMSVMYIPIDSVLPKTLADRLGVSNFLAGVNRDRVKTATLRGEPSQGILADPTLLSEFGLEPTATPEEITAKLGVTKYEPPIKITMGGTLLPLPQGLSKYDIEGAERKADFVAKLLTQPCVILEKMEGTNVSVSLDLVTGQVSVNQRENAIVCAPGEDNSYWSTAQQQGMLEKVVTLGRQFPTTKGIFAIYGELIGPGINGNIYGVKKLQIQVYDMRLGKGFLPWAQVKAMAATTELPLVPIIAENVTLGEWLNGRTLAHASNGISLCGNSNAIREGIVIKPMEEAYFVGHGRLIIKQRDPVYLSKSEN